MKAAIYQGKENIEIKELPDPVCTDDGVILENIYASICGTDVAVYKHGTGYGYKGETSNVDIYIDAAGADEILDYYQDNGKVDSRLVMVAVGTNERNINVLGMTFGQLAIIGSGGYTPEDVRDVMNIMESNKWDIEKIITHEFSFLQIEDAIKIAGDPNSALNVVVKY